MNLPAAPTSVTSASAALAGESLTSCMAAGTPSPATRSNQSTTPAPAQLTPMVLDRPEAAGVLRIGVRKLDELLADPTLAFPRIRFGDRVLIPVEALLDWIAQKTKQDTPAPRDLPKIGLAPSGKNRRSHSDPGSGTDAQ